jgi:hypothetical protein
MPSFYNNDVTWSSWTSYDTSGTVTSYDPGTTSGSVWYTWSNSTTTSGTWTTWSTGPTATVTIGPDAWSQWITSDVSYAPPSQQQLSPEAIAAEQARIREAADARQREREAAVVKAKALLASLLDEKQREQLERHRFFEFVSQTGRKMRMKHGHSRNIDELGDDGRRVRTLCAHPGQYDLVDEDHMVAQLLTLQHDEAAFLRVANAS